MWERWLECCLHVSVRTHHWFQSLWSRWDPARPYSPKPPAEPWLRVCVLFCLHLSHGSRQGRGSCSSAFGRWCHSGRRQGRAPHLCFVCGRRPQPTASTLSHREDLMTRPPRTIPVTDFFAATPQQRWSKRQDGSADPLVGEPAGFAKLAASSVVGGSDPDGLPGGSPLIGPGGSPLVGQCGCRSSGEAHRGAGAVAAEVCGEQPSAEACLSQLGPACDAGALACELGSGERTRDAAGDGVMFGSGGRTEVGQPQEVAVGVGWQGAAGGGMHGQDSMRWTVTCDGSLEPRQQPRADVLVLSLAVMLVAVAVLRR